MDPSKLPKELIRVLQDRDLTMSKKMVAFNMFIPNLPADPRHTQAYNDNLKVGETIKRLVGEDKIRLGRFDKHFKLDVTIY